jgi:hypothetical protein
MLVAIHQIAKANDSEEVELSLVLAQLTRLPFWFGPCPHQALVSLSPDTMLFKLAAPFKSQQRILKPLNIALSPKDHVPKNYGLRKAKDPTSPRAPQCDEAHAEVVCNHFLWNKVWGKFHQSYAAPVELAVETRPAVAK